VNSTLFPLGFARVLYAITLVVEIGGGLLLLIGFQARAATAVLGLFTIAAAILFHSNFADQNQAVHFLKNFAIAGGLLHVAAVGAGRFSLDARRSATLQVPRIRRRCALSDTATRGTS
jgi:putative oxidoreductase